MLTKIISGGQTGADRAALDVAIKFNIEHGGWVPKGRKTEDGPLPMEYQLLEMPTDDYRERTRQNIVDSHGTLIIYRGALTGGSKLTHSYAKVIGRPNCVVNLSTTEEFEAAIFVKTFILENSIKILNTAGPRLSHQPWIYNDVKTVLETALYLLFLDTHQDRVFKDYIPGDKIEEAFPSTVKEAVELLSDDLPLKTKTFIAKFEPGNIHKLYFSFLEYIRHRLGFDTGNQPLLLSADTTEANSLTVEDAVMVILKQLKQSLETHHILRVVK